MKLKHAVQFRAGGTPDTGDESFWADAAAGTPWVAIGDMSRGSEVLTTAKSLTTAGLASRGLIPERPGTVLFAMYASVGAVATLGINATWNQAILGIVPNERTDARFVAYWLRHYAPQAVAEARSATQANLNAEQVANFPFPNSSLQSQRRIADFLDDRVARIDQIIAERGRQIELLDAQLSAHWSALDGELLSRFPMAPIRRLLKSIVDGPFGSSLTSAHYSDEGTRVIRLGNVGLGEFRDEDKAYVPSEYGDQLSAHAVSPGDLIMAGLGDERWPLGRCAVAPEDLGPAIVKADCYRIRLDDRMLHEFAALFLSGTWSRAAFNLLSRGATRARLNTDLARGAEVPVASIAVQRSYCEAVRLALRDSAASRSTWERAIELLTEYKQSLITAAVTGELDVTTASRGIPG